MYTRRCHWSVGRLTAIVFGLLGSWKKDFHFIKEKKTYMLQITLKLKITCCGS